ncbi:MAG TPA: hypothetical protein VK750_06315 [Cytophagaceae bacterium]|jgi:hypothetical protein|nr:hypothetical protein [Cytophagaceae bacterium]
MKVRSSYPVEMSAILLIGIFLLSCFFSHYVFDVPLHEAEHRETIYFGMFLIGIAVVLATLVVWEELLFHVRLKRIADDGVLFRNNPNKLLIQICIYLCIPIIYAYVYLNYKVDHLFFIIWLAACMGVPVINKLKSSIENYHDFLKFTPTEIEYKNNEKTGLFLISQISSIRILKNQQTMTEKLEITYNGDIVIIDLNEMELEGFFDPIEHYIEDHYTSLLKA